MKLPKYVVLKSMYNNKYLSYRDEPGKEHDGFLQFSEDDPTSLYSKFEVKMSTSEKGSFHLMCSFNDKYLVRKSSSENWIRGSSNQSEEDKSKWSCTLFKPVLVTDHNGDQKSMVVRFLHVQLNHYACLFKGDPKDCLYAGWSSPNKELCDACSVIDWESLHDTRVIPKRFGDSSKKPMPPTKPNPVPEKKQDPLKPKPVQEKKQDPPKPKPVPEMKQTPPKLKSVPENTQDPPNPKAVVPEKKQDPLKPKPSPGKETVESDQLDFNVISSADKFWGAVFAFTKILPKALPQTYKSIKIMRGDGFSQGSIHEISFTQGDVEKLEEKIAYVDHETKTITWSLIQGGMLTHYETFKITITVSPKKRRDRGCRVNWSYVGTNPKPGFDKDGLMKLFQKTFEAVDDYLEANEARD
uniref:Amaranthin-like lectin n=1 Tax=Linum usitatissimum TaxID=4006 RepID=A0A097PIE1_LINUS|nr:amaranthin-like lectin [Linum usitatissimum]